METDYLSSYPRPLPEVVYAVFNILFDKFNEPVYSCDTLNYFFTFDFGIGKMIQVMYGCGDIVLDIILPA